MTRAPYVMSKAAQAFARNAELFDTSIGWRFVNPRMRDTLWYGLHGTDSRERRRDQFDISREDQDSLPSIPRKKQQQPATKVASTAKSPRSTIPPEKRGKEPTSFAKDEFLRPDTTIEVLSKLRPAFRTDGKGSVTAGNSSGINDGSAALLIASEEAVNRYNLTPMARIVSSAAAGVEPRTMGMGPVPSSRKALAKAGLNLSQMNVIELNEAFASQSLACIRELGLTDDDPRINANGGAIAIGHPLGMSGARLILTAAHELKETGGQYALCTMCVGVGQGMATIIERV